MARRRLFHPLTRYSMRPPHARKIFSIVLGALLFSAPSLAQQSPRVGTTTFVLDGNRMFAELSFVRRDGSLHKALAFVDMGSPSTSVTELLFKELGLDRGKSLVFRVGDLTVQVPSAEVSSDPDPPYSLGSNLKVEAVLPAGVLQQFQVQIDYRNRTLTLARPGTMQPHGQPVPFHLNKTTGLIAVDAIIDGTPYPVTIDNGSAYSWFRQSTVSGWLRSHPDWKRGVGAVGASNMMMSGDGAESSGILLRLPEMSVGSITLQQVGVLGAGAGRSPFPNQTLFDWYSTKNAIAVIGWIGGNVLKNFQITIDYPNQTMYWLKQSDPDAHDLDVVGLTLRSEHRQYFVAAVATKNGAPTVVGVMPGDKLIRVGDLETSNATKGAIFNAMRGKPGETRNLVLERNGHRLNVDARVTAF